MHRVTRGPLQPSTEAPSWSGRHDARAWPHQKHLRGLACAGRRSTPFLPTGASLLRRKLLELEGWAVAPVPHYEWGVIGSAPPAEARRLFGADRLGRGAASSVREGMDRLADDQALYLYSLIEAARGA